MQVLHTLTRAMHLSDLGFHAILARRHGEIKAPSSRRIWYHRFYMMFVFENINQGLDEGEMVGGDDVSLHFDAGPSLLFVWLLQGFLEFGTYQLPTSEVPSLAWLLVSKLEESMKINTKQTPNQRQAKKYSN